MPGVGDNHVVGIEHHDIAGFPHLDFGNHIRNHRQVDIQAQNAQRLPRHAFNRSKDTYSRGSLGGLKGVGNAHLIGIGHAFLEPVTAAGIIAFLALYSRILQITAICGTIAYNRYAGLIGFPKALKQLIGRQFKTALGLRVHSNHSIGSRRSCHRFIHIAGDFPAISQNRVISHIDQAIAQAVQE